MKNKKLFIVALLIILVGVGLFFFLRKPKTQTTEEDSKASLPINTIPISDRPFVTLTPDSAGRNLTLTLDNTTLEELVEYELVYNATEKQEGAFGRINLATETQPVEKKLLLGSQSGGGKITYHEGITGGSLTLTYDEIKLKENFNFLRFDKTEESYSSVDTRFQASFSSKDLNNDAVIIIMKSFGLPAAIEGDILAGPYAVLTAAEAIPSEVSLKLSDISEGTTPALYEYVSGEWQKIEATTEGSTISSTENEGFIFLVLAE